MSNKIKKKEFKQIQNQAQEGRSMVEMLGVLAIIGVLSIGGIAGYRWGMDKHVSNQILYEMNLNSAQLAMLLQKGNPEGVTLSLGSPYDEGKFRTVEYEFDYGCGESEADEVADYQCQPAETGYFMKATGLPKRVCNMLGDAVFGMAYYYDSEINGGDNDNECNDTGNTVTVFFDTDTTIEGGIPRPEGPETRTTMAEVTEPITTTETTMPETTTTEATTTTEVTTHATTTVTTSSHIVSDCENGGLLNYYTFDYNNAYFSYCECKDGFTGERCEKPTGKCTTNEDCKEQYKNDNYYCHFDNSNCDGPTGTGYCHENTGTQIGGGFLLKRYWMNWWSAKNFCESHNREMLSLSYLCSNASEIENKAQSHIETSCVSDKIEWSYDYSVVDTVWLTEGYGSCNVYRVDFFNGRTVNDSSTHIGFAFCK